MFLWVLLLSSCVVHNSRGTFRVVPGTPDYVLESPDAHHTPFLEVLKAYNGFEPGQGWVDLGNLMELSVENAYYQPGFARSGLAGFLGTETARYAVENDGLRLLSVEAMKSRPNADLPVQDLISNRETKFSHYRLYFEIIFPQGKQSHGSVLLGAKSKEELGRLGAELARPESVCYPGSANCTVFPEACSVSVEMKVFVNGKPEMVPWGSLLERVANHARRIRMERLYEGRLTRLRVPALDVKTLRLPLLPGDRIALK